MRTSWLACALLLLGAVNSLPQYGGGGGGEDQQTQGQGEVVVNDGPTDFSTFTPQQSSDCSLNFGCVPWQYCSGDVFNYVADIELSTYIPDDVSATASLCGQTGNMCCRIP